MKKDLSKIAFIFLLFIINGCSGVSEDKVVGRYYLVAVDYEEEGTTLSYKLEDGNTVGIVDNTVFAVGYNDKFMIVKQHPRIFPNPPDKTITNYYILPLKKSMDWRSKNGLIGPLTLEQFNEKRRELQIGTEIRFIKEIEDLK